MPINRIYNGNRLIRCFTDSEMRHNFLPISVRSDKITYACSNSNFNNAFVINHVNGKHTINIDWNRIIMTKPVEVFDLYIKYDGDVRITECVRIEYPLSEVRFNVQLSKKSGIWGEQPNCELIITPSYSRSEEWKYKNKLVRVSFEKEKDNTFYPTSNSLEHTFKAKKGISIPLCFKFKNSPIKSKEKFNVSFSIDGESMFASFYFDPKPITQSSYTINIERLEKNFEYGTHNIPVFLLWVETNDDYVIPTQISTVVFSHEAPFLYRVHNGKHLIYVDSSSLRWVTEETKFNVDITLTNSLRFSKEICICTKDTYKSNSIYIKPGQGPVLRLLPNNSVDIYQNEEIEVGLEIGSILSSPLTIIDISSNDASYKYNGKKIELKGNEKRIIPITIKGTVNRTISYSVYTKEANVVKVSLNVRVKKKEDIIILPKFIINENFELVYQDGYETDETCGNITIEENKHGKATNPYIKEDFHLQSADFYIKSSLVNGNSFIYIINIREGAFSNKESISTLIKKDEKKFYPLSWEYHNQRGQVLIPILEPAYYKISYCRENIKIFPHPEDGRKIKLFDIGIIEPTKSYQVLDDKQEIAVPSPFFMKYHEEEVQHVFLTEPSNIPLYVDADKINQIPKDAINIESSVNIEGFIVRKTRRLGERLKPIQLILEPIIEEAKLKSYFITDKGEEILLNSKRKKQAEIKIYEQSEDVKAMKLGCISFRNEGRIPCKGKELKFDIKKIEAKVSADGRNLLHNDTLSFLSTEIKIQNGGDDYNVPIFIDYPLWRRTPHNERIILSIEIAPFDHPTIVYNTELTITHLFVDDIYALDLGTTGIVVAKEKDGEQEIVILDDAEELPIERDKEIISSHTMLIANGVDGKSEIKLAPSGLDYYGKTEAKRFRLVPYKFIIGQERIPYLRDYYDDNSLCKIVKLFGLENCEIELTPAANRNKNQKTISSLIGSLYKGIFKRFSKEAEQIKKLVITYPNTYTIENLESIKSVLSDELGLNLTGQITFVPESDAVAAYYFDQKIMRDGGFFDEEGNLKSDENVVIYDMGAGTLDLSLISFKQTGSGIITASIVNKIGIPLAGNYLRYLMYKTLKDKKKLKSDKEFKDNTIHELVEGIKREYKEPDKPIVDLRPSWFTAEQDKLEIKNEDTYNSIFKESLEDFLTCCSETVIKLLNPGDIKIDTIVFSGRASQFSSLRERVIKSLENMGCNAVKVDDLLPTCNCGDHLKTCVAIGALKYQCFFNNNESFRIENKNIYSKIAVVYWGRRDGRFDVRVNYLIDPQSANWDDADFINGTWCKEFCASLNISEHLPGKNLFYIQTSLDESRIKSLFKKVYLNDPTSQNDLNWAFVNILFKQRIVDSVPFSISLRISKDNKILDRRIGNALLSDTKLLENVEDNLLYKRSMWPFITKLNENEY